MFNGKQILSILKKTAKNFGANNPLMLASSTAFFTVFSIPPTIIITANILSLYFKNEDFIYSIVTKIDEYFGESVASQMRTIASNFQELASEPWITYAGFAFLIFVATNLFKVVTLSINQIWKVRTTSRKKIKYTLLNRAIGLGIIILTGILFIVSSALDSFVSANINSFLNFTEFNEILVSIGSKLTSIFFLTIWFAMIYRFLPSARVKWKNIIVGSIFTAVLLTIGKYLLETFLINSNINNIFETSTSVIIILLFIFYSSFIVYFGASFIYIYTLSKKDKIYPAKNAERIKVETVELEA
ncbi:YihY/virulence factor BrkB family protein [Mangrovivirga sp. M17]|uniref:YihY/virulence factor BrkB family protein n=1 Tax=Mangrovivirga halotolerans TaxID=2993936 RepID=A0ABT3RMV6_9BACT|nr:YihY/virulence factor BrkB family protein [Mangrovivirga halotolerans]MCX2743144.1 YihY/virulence factor BrkB family protein [Mangrovivirga halotolerans]